MMLPAPSQAESPRRTRIKICGITSVEMAMVAVEAGADAVGLVHAQGSPRCVSTALAQEIARNLPLTVQAVSVYRNHALEDLTSSATEVVQLHGDEDERYIESLRNPLPNVRVIRAISFNRASVARWDACERIDALLIEGPSAGTGTSFDCAELAAMMPSLSKPVILAGGLTPRNIGEAIEKVRPYGVDVSSGVESKRGVKDATLIREFCAAVREADRP